MEQPIRPPYGDVFFVGTPAMDRVGAMMINDQKQRELNYQKQAQALETEFAKNVSGMRDADIPELTEKWNEYKKTKQKLYSEGNKLSDEERIALQMEAQRKLGDAYATINKSKSEREQEDLTAKSYLKNPNQFEEITPEFLRQRRKMPISKVSGTEFEDIYGNTQLKTEDFSKAIVTAMGGTKPVKKTSFDELSPDGIKKQTTEVFGYNSPHEYAASLANQVFSDRKTNHLIKQFSIPDQKANEIVQKYTELTQTPAFKAAYPNEPEFSPEDMQDPLKRTIALMSMEHILLHPPTLTVKKDDSEALMKKRLANAKEMEDIRNANIINRGKGGTDNSLVNNIYGVIEGEVNKNIANGNNPTALNALPADAIDVILKIARTNTGDSKIGIGDVALFKSPNGNIGIYEADPSSRKMIYDPTHPSRTLIGELSRVGTNIGKQADVKAKRAVVAEGNSQPKKSYSLKGKTFSQSQVEAAAKASGMSVDEYIKEAGLK